ncbi:MAG: hypothetical protein COV79_00820 [Parcubacteria group bacterium CG11_big_fil_rev_8_21_14_0_20_41_14]|nr:MAG: hypothetical protein COV79_00820 [Parcubacteria group bacterium CG11_big_fil_rev_8_21_14_0_20_41_14]PIR57203.1 MAG: hypothetical protein COU72_02185 [Parcubacteria group bacterium CG10_big_fil_rev_8_21_14_0_10_41_35]
MEQVTGFPYQWQLLQLSLELAVAMDTIQVAVMLLMVGVHPMLTMVPQSQYWLPVVAVEEE